MDTTVVHVIWMRILVSVYLAKTIWVSCFKYMVSSKILRYWQMLLDLSPKNISWRADTSPLVQSIGIWILVSLGNGKRDLVLYFLNIVSSKDINSLINISTPKPVTNLLFKSNTKGCYSIWKRILVSVENATKISVSYCINMVVVMILTTW
jgi:hypothetical protein